MVESVVKNTLKKYNLCKKKEKILVAMSGGKDSSVVAYLLKRFGYDVYGIYIDLKMGDYSERCFDAVRKLCDVLGIDLYVYDVKKEMGGSMCYIRSHVQSKSSLKNCAVCGVIKKWILNKEARRLGADKIATGHNLDDEAQTFLMNMFKGSLSLSANTGAIIKNKKDGKFIPRIKPLFYVPENDIRKYSKKMKLPVVYDKCPCAIDSYRIQVRGFLNGLSSVDKKRIVRNFEKVILGIDKLDGEIKYCKFCGEPSRGGVCRMCRLLR